jgi:NADPH:quinone reductase-like Zn-dependent oxidoreductase
MTVRGEAKLKAVQFAGFGPPDVLELIDAPTPKATDGNAVVQISAAAINPSDVKNVAGQMEGTVVPRIPGRDFAGIVVDGPDNWVGVEVFGTGAISASRATAATPKRFSCPRKLSFASPQTSPSSRQHQSA